MLLFFSFISATIGFITAKFTYSNYESDLPQGNTQQSHPTDNINVSVAPNRPKVETSTIPSDERNLMTISQVSSTAISANVEITTETAVYNQLYGHYVTEGAGSGVIISKDG